VVAAPAQACPGGLETGSTGQTDRCNNFFRGGAAKDGGRTPVDYPVPHGTIPVVRLVPGQDELAAGILVTAAISAPPCRNSISTVDLLVVMTGDGPLTHRSRLCSSRTDEFRAQAESYLQDSIST
jgi:hypothetical protein